MSGSARKIWAEMIQTKTTQIIRCTEEIEELNGYIRDDIEKEQRAEEQGRKVKCIPLKEHASDYDRGFHQAMTLAREWNRSLREGDHK